MKHFFGYTLFFVLVLGACDPNYQPTETKVSEQPVSVDGRSCIATELHSQQIVPSYTVLVEDRMIDVVRFEISCGFEKNRCRANQSLASCIAGMEADLRRNEDDDGGGYSPPGG